MDETLRLVRLQFVKDYRGELTRAAAESLGSDDDGLLRVLFSVILEDEDMRRRWPSPPAELALLAPHKSVRELQEEASRAFQETYLVMANFQVDRIKNLEADEGAILFGMLDSGAHLVVEGSGIDAHSEWRYEGGADSWIVNCPCGARDDDGERMICCDGCEIWQHTRCASILDAAPVPDEFFCSTCLQSPALVPCVSAIVEDVQPAFYEQVGGKVAWGPEESPPALGGFASHFVFEDPVAFEDYEVEAGMEDEVELLDTTMVAPPLVGLGEGLLKGEGIGFGNAPMAWTSHGMECRTFGR
eukprot:TRINITY_DN12354_c0_g1_i2.p1 TRINITY_DN12354_c0_g1~~TRINITY_DN12354_c0_g1_i2.p1  ORF type:complete len:301 (+),score=56.48 TRINITY_DN12354_c0_g1_i2:3-905(+)